MVQEEKQNKKQNIPYACPHWSLGDRSCLLSREGLYLPVDEHVEVYCEGGNFSSCSHFMQHFPAEKSGQSHADETENRRRYPRVPARFSFRLAERSGEDLERVLEDVATTVDLSAGGLRFETYRALPKGTEVVFSMNGSFTPVPLQGVGQVKWCRSLEDAPLYHAGIAFADSAVGVVVAERLGLTAS